MKHGLFIVFEGIDGTGKSTQRTRLDNYMNNLGDSREDILKTREPWRSDEVTKRLESDKNAYSGAERIAQLYVEDRIHHSNFLIKPDLALGCHILSDRYIVSTLAYQSTMGLPLDKLMEMHYGKGLLVPDITFLLDVSTETSMKRIGRRKRKLEKFESREFLERLRQKYLEIAKSENKDLGQIVTINGERSINEVSDHIKQHFDLIYSHWKENPTKDIKTI